MAEGNLLEEAREVVALLSQEGRAEDSDVVSDLADALEACRAEKERLREKARAARSQAAAPDYDEEAIRDALWAVVDEALAATPTSPAPKETP